MDRKLNTEWEVLTSDGYQDFYGIKKTKKESIKIYFDDGTHIVCSLEHKFYENKKYVYANTLKIGDCLSNKKIVDIQNNGEVELYDLLEVENGHHYTMSGVEGSNCAFIPKNIWNDFYTSTMPTISSGKQSKMIMVSCVVESTLVMSTKYGARPISFYINKKKKGAYEVPEYKVLGKDKERTGHIMYNAGVAKTKIIKAKHAQLECSYKHKLWINRDGQHSWIEASKLKVGDLISIQCGSNLLENNMYYLKSVFKKEDEDITQEEVYKTLYVSTTTNNIEYLQVLQMNLIDAGFLPKIVRTRPKNPLMYVLTIDDYFDKLTVVEEPILSIEESKNKVYDFSLDDDPEDEFAHSVIYNGIIGHQTPKGQNHFYDFWKNAIDGKSNMYPMEVNWWDVPGRDEAWRIDMLKTMTEEQFNVEYGNSFDASTNTLISPDKFSRLARNIKEPEQANKNLKIYEVPIPMHEYIATCDCASVGIDYSTISIIDISVFPYKQVAVYADDKISHLSFPQIIFQLCTKYNNAEVLVESNDIGNTILHILNFDLEYEYIIKTYRGGNQTPVLGQRTTAKTKSVGCARMKDMIETNNLIIQDKATLDEIRHFVLTGSSYAGEQGFHDDLVMGIVNFAYYATTPQFKMKYDKSFQDEFREEYDKQIVESLTPIPLFSNNNYGNIDNDTTWLK